MLVHNAFHQGSTRNARPKSLLISIGNCCLCHKAQRKHIKNSFGSSKNNFMNKNVFFNICLALSVLASLFMLFSASYKVKHFKCWTTLIQGFLYISSYFTLCSYYCSILYSGGYHSVLTSGWNIWIEFDSSGMCVLVLKKDSFQIRGACLAFCFL